MSLHANHLVHLQVRNQHGSSVHACITHPCSHSKRQINTRPRTLGQQRYNPLVRDQSQHTLALAISYTSIAIPRWGDESASQRGQRLVWAKSGTDMRYMVVLRPLASSFLNNDLLSFPADGHVTRNDARLSAA